MAQQQKTAILYTQGYGGVPSGSLQTAIVQTRDPGGSDLSGSIGTYPIGQKWVNTAANNTFSLTSIGPVNGTLVATWTQEAVGGGGDLEQLTGDSGTATPTSSTINIAGGTGISTAATGSTVTITNSQTQGAVTFHTGGSDATVAAGAITLAGGTGISTAGSGSTVTITATGSSGASTFNADTGSATQSGGTITIAGTGSQIHTVGSSHTVTLSIPSAFVAPGSIQSTGTITAVSGQFIGDSGILITTSGANSALGNDNGNGAISIGGGGSRQLQFGNNNSGTNVTLTSNAGTIAMTGSPSPITITSSPDLQLHGNLNFKNVGNRLFSTNVGSTTSAGSNSFGTVTLSGGAATVNTDQVGGATMIFLTVQSLGTVVVPTAIAVTAVNPTTSFTITSVSGIDTSVVAWFLIN